MNFFSVVRHLSFLSPKAVPLLQRAAAYSCISAFLFPIPILAAWFIVNQLLTEGLNSGLPILICVIAAVAIFVGIISRVRSSVLAHQAAFVLAEYLCVAVMEHLSKVPTHCLSKYSSGGLKKVLSYDIEQIEHFVAHNITDTIASLVLPIGSIIGLMFISWQLGLVVLLIMILAILMHVINIYIIKNNDLNDEYYSTTSMLHADAVEFVQGMQDIKIFNSTSVSFKRMQIAVDNFKKIQYAIRRIFTGQIVTFATITTMPFALIAIAGAFLHKSHGLPIEDLILFLMLGVTCIAPLARLAQFSMIMWKAGVGYSGIKGLLDLPIEKRGNRLHTEINSANLSVENLSINYEGKPILKNVSFTARAGTITAIVGQSGSGKSTLASVLAGMEEINSGRITVDDIPLESFSNKELSKVMAVVFQQPFIFSGTIAENICLGLENIPREHMVKACRMVQCDTLIEKFPNGYDTSIGSSGDIHLSGGQSQRIALARMALRNAKIVVLDEASAFADPESEEAIQQGLAAFLADKTVLVIAHRLPSIAKADNILVFEKGSIVENGTHDELMSMQGLYSKMWDAYKTSRSWMIKTNVELTNKA